MNPLRKPIRSVLLAVLAASAALAPTTGPAHAAPPKHTVTVMVTSIEVVDSLDLNACGEFNALRLIADTGSTTPKGMNVIPKGAQVEYWNTGSFTYRGTFSMCQGSTYSVAQTNLPELAASWTSWNGSDLFAFEPVESKSLNRLAVAASPGEAVALETFSMERDYSNSGAFVEGAREVTAPAAGKNASFTMSVDNPYLYWGSETTMIVRGVVSTSATPTS